MKFKKRKQEYLVIYIAIQQETKLTYIIKEVTPLSELIGIDRATIYRKFKKEGDFWVKNGYEVYKCININLKSRRGN